jgi:hypothetical protein
MRSVRGASKVQQLEPEPAYLVKKGMQVALLELAAEHCRCGFDMDVEIAERFACDRA